MIPHLVVRFLEQPREGVNTKQAGWMKNPQNVKTIEEVMVVDRFNKQHVTAPVIINLINGEVMANRTNKPDEEMVAHYVERYEEMIRDALRVWAEKSIRG